MSDKSANPSFTVKSGYVIADYNIFKQSVITYGSYNHNLSYRNFIVATTSQFVDSPPCLYRDRVTMSILLNHFLRLAPRKRLANERADTSWQSR